MFKVITGRGDVRYVENGYDIWVWSDDDVSNEVFEVTLEGDKLIGIIVAGCQTALYDKYFANGKDVLGAKLVEYLKSGRWMFGK